MTFESDVLGICFVDEESQSILLQLFYRTRSILWLYFITHYESYFFVLRRKLKEVNVPETDWLNGSLNKDIPNSMEYALYFSDGW